MDNADLILRATKGDADALEALLRRYQQWMQQIVLKTASPQLLLYADADEIIQHAMAGCFRAIKELSLEEEPQARFEAWLAKVIRNAVHYFGRKRRHALLQMASDVGDALPDKGPTVSKLQRRKERYERLNAAIAKFPEDTQKMIELSLKGRTLQEIADQLGMTRPAVNARLERARRRLHEMLGSASLNLSSE